MSEHKYISNIVQSEFIYLIWKSPKGNRFPVGKLYRNDRFEYIAKHSAYEAGFTCYAAFAIFTEAPLIEYSEPIKVFSRRLPPKSRSDYGKFLALYGLDHTLDAVKNISDFDLLAYTGAHLTDNPFSFANPFKDCKPPFQFVMQAAAFERYGVNFNNNDLLEQSLSLCPEPENPKDKEAISVKFGEEKIAYISRSYTEAFHEWLIHGFNIDLTVFRINGADEHRYLYLFVSVS
jgi:hypothetical protein